MRKVYIFGSGVTGQLIYEQIKNDTEVIGWLDNDLSKSGKKVMGIPIIGNIPEGDFDEIIIGSLPGLHPIKDYLLSIGIPENKIITRFLELYVEAREFFLKDYALLTKDKDEEFAVAEGGVLQGDFARVINTCFPNRKLYLFDTFEGFDEKDIEIEKKRGYSTQEAGHLNITSERLVMSKMSHPENVVIKKGYFPDTVEGLEDLRFVFVNLDFDLYNPTLEGLKFFYPRMAEHSVLLIHDYFNNGAGYSGVQKAVADYEKLSGIKLAKLPIGDHYSLAIYKMGES